MSGRYIMKLAASVLALAMLPVGLCQCVSLEQPASGMTLDRTADTAMAARLYGHVDKLVSGFGKRSYLDTQNLERIAAWLAAEFKKAGCQTSEQLVRVEGRTYRNVIGVIPGKSTAKIIIGAHYDACGETPGADDNASAVAGLLELASLFGRETPQHTIELVAYCNEEPPYFGTENMGSFHHARLVRERGERVTAMICLEMIGYYSDEQGSQKYPSPLLRACLPSTGNFVGVVGNGASVSLAKLIQHGMNKVSSMPVARANIPESIGLSLDFSDHRNYWAMGFPAVMITDTAFYRNPNYHEPTDTPDTLDYMRMSDVVKALHRAIMALDQKEKPAEG